MHRQCHARQRGHGDHRPNEHARTMPPTTATAGWLHRPLPRERPHLTRCTKILCSAFLTLLLVAGVLLFVAYLAVRPHRPRFHVTAFSAVGIQQAGSTNDAVVLSGQLSIRNPNQDVAFFYDRLYMSVLYRQYGAVVKDHALAGGAPMYQPPKTTSLIAFEGVAVPAGPATADMARAAAEGGGAVEFTVKVRSRIRAKVAVWGFHWHPLHVDCEVAVGPDGQLLPEARQKRCDIDFL